MAYVMTYTTLLEDLRNYLERGFTSDSDPILFDQLPRLITLAERQINVDFTEFLGFVRAVNTTISQGTSTIEKPDRWRDTISFSITNSNGKLYIFPRSYEYCRNYWPDASTEQEPEFYADYDYNHWLVAPTPDQDYSTEILYHELIPLLGPDNQTNWLTAYAPNLILYGALLQATPFLKNDDRIGTWQGFYSQHGEALNKSDISKISDRSTARTEA